MTKIDIISGFLGAGKTTFIKKMIDEAFKGEQIVLIENEFGEVGIDGGFLKDAGIEITEMNSGCICCSLVGDFGKNLREVIEKYHPDRILIEPSGVGKLSDVMKSVMDVEKELDVKMNALVTVVNALKASKQMKAFGEFFNNQIEHATTVILSRSQNATEEQLEFCVKQIQELNPKAAIITTAWDAISGEQILKAMEGQDNLKMKLLAEASHAREEAAHHHEHDENCTCGCHASKAPTATPIAVSATPSPMTRRSPAWAALFIPTWATAIRCRALRASRRSSPSATRISTPLPKASGTRWTRTTRYRCLCAISTSPPARRIPGSSTRTNKPVIKSHRKGRSR